MQLAKVGLGLPWPGSDRCSWPRWDWVYLGQVVTGAAGQGGTGSTLAR